MYTIENLKGLLPTELKTIANNLGMADYNALDAENLIYQILDHQARLPEKKVETKAPSKKSKEKKEKKEAPEKETRKKALPKKEKAPKKGAEKEEKQGILEKKMEKKEESPKVEKTKNFAFENFVGTIEVEGLVELMNDGYGFFRSSDYNYMASPDDLYISHQQIKKWRIKKGDMVKGTLRPPKENEKYFGLASIDSVNGRTLEELNHRTSFDHLKPIFPEERFELSFAPDQYSTRVVDLLAPIGKGQRAMIVAPPKTGKTTLLKQIANGIAHNYPEVYLIVLMIGERPEEVTDMQRSVEAEVVASTFDQPAENHVKVADLILSKAKNMVECGHDVAIILDSITRLSRAHNIVAPSSGKILSGGIDAHAMYHPKRFFGAARNIENGGSLTIIASALIDTGSRMDEYILEDLTGTGNMDLFLTPELMRKGLFPPVDPHRSSTRRWDALHSKEMVKNINMLRHIMNDMKKEEAIDFLLSNMRGTRNNQEFLASMHQ